MLRFNIYPPGDATNISFKFGHCVAKSDEKLIEATTNSLLVDSSFLGPRGPLGSPSSVRPWVQKIWINCTASQTHITIHIPKPHDKYYPLTPRDDNDKYTRKDKDKDNDKDEMTKRPNMFHIFENDMTQGYQIR